ncbi:MAG TPA: hypothetical protein VFR47_11630 [Anaerolineales bacterium]|nr:hypothetical protein [Anaerolineales bacterium]
MQTRLLPQTPSEGLRVYAVWLPRLWSDKRESWDPAVLPEPRVIHFWDGDAQVGEWFARKVDAYEGIAWDVYYLYGPDATWETIPEPLVGSGGTIIDEREKLKMEVGALIGK